MLLPGWPYHCLIAHRGAGKQAPENTLAAFRLGYAHGYRMFECDVKLSADDVAYLMHDGTLERTTNGTGSPLNLNWSELSQLDAGSWHSADYAGEPLPTLKNIAQFVQANGCLINLEIKPVPGAEAHTGAEVARQARELWKNATVPPLLSSFSMDALAAARDAVPELPRALLATREIEHDWRQHIQRLGCIALDTHYSVMTPELIAACHALKLRTLVYTVNDDATARQLLAAGVDGVITDEVHVIRPDQS
jgi:glycerophosphoryl diester phosphodiesterase